MKPRHGHSHSHNCASYARGTTDAMDAFDSAGRSV